MNSFSILIMSLSMSADAFAVSISKGVEMKTPSWSKALQVGILFGLIEALTPILGWLAGSAASSFIESIDHWIAFVILVAVGARMIYQSIKAQTQKSSAQHKTALDSDSKLELFSSFGSLGLLILTAIGTSIDAMAVGVSLAFIDANIWIAAACIGAATACMVFIGMIAGHYLGAKVGKSAEALGGLALILIGTHILLSHTGYL